VRGGLLFRGKAICANGHSREELTANRPKGIGLFNERELNDPDRGSVAKDPLHAGLWTPSLRKFAATYIHPQRHMFAMLHQESLTAIASRNGAFI